MPALRRPSLPAVLLSIALAALIAGLLARLAARPDLAAPIWAAGVVPVLAALIVEIARSLWRGEVGLDIVAALSMSAALVFGESLAAAVVAVMYTGGSFLESYAEGRARHEMHALLARVPRRARRLTGETLEEVPLDAIVTVQNFHDLYLKPFPEGTGDKASAALFAALKPGGTLVVVDHSAADGSGTTLSDSLHRIDKAAVVAALTKAGFLLEAESDLYKRPEDPRTANVFDPAIRGKTDQFTLRFRKPE